MNTNTDHVTNVYNAALHALPPTNPSHQASILVDACAKLIAASLVYHAPPPDTLDDFLNTLVEDIRDLVGYANEHPEEWK